METRNVTMIRPRWRKVFRDLFEHPTRTILVVLSIAIGVAAFGTILITRIRITERLQTTFLGINPASARITTTAFDDDLVDAVRNIPGIATAEGQRIVNARIEVAPGEWADLELHVLPDDGERSIHMIKPWAGTWPLDKRMLWIERSSLPDTRANLGDTLRVALPGQDPRSMPISGLTYDLSTPPAMIAGKIFGYVNEETLVWLGGPTGYNQILVVVAEGRTDEEHIWAMAGEVERKIERSGRPVLNTDVPTPLQHPVEVVLPTIILLMTMFGLLALLISGFLISNTISSILTQQIRQIAVMKAIGARTGQIMVLYVVLAASFGGLALALAVPLSMLGGYAMTSFIGSQFNIDIVGLQLPTQVLILELLAAVLLPVFTAAGPIHATVQLTVREALSGNTNPPTAASPLDTVLRHLHTIARPTRLALRNTFRRKGRLVRTLIPLALGGAVFVSAITLRFSLELTLDESIASQNYDIEVFLGRSYRIERVTPIAADIPGVVDIEPAASGVGFPVRADGSTEEEILLQALPADSLTFAPRMTDGRWLVPGDDRSIVLSSNYLLKYPGTAVGDKVRLQIENEEQDWHIVGFIEEFVPPVNPALGYVTIDTFTRLVGGVGHTDTLRILTDGHDALAHAAYARELEARLEAKQIDVRLIRSRSEDRTILTERFDVLTGVLSLISTIIGTVGGLGLAGTMSINVLERRREIGVMRAIGAGNGALQQVIISEGLVIALIAWILGFLLAIPMSMAMCTGIGLALLNIPLIWDYSFLAVAGWLLIVLTIAVIASYIPARSASMVTVREVLAYE
jgi:putative ABC transport system permease protein